MIIKTVERNFPTISEYIVLGVEDSYLIVSKPTYNQCITLTLKAEEQNIVNPSADFTYISEEVYNKLKDYLPKELHIALPMLFLAKFEIPDIDSAIEALSIILDKINICSYLLTEPMYRADFTFGPVTLMEAKDSSKAFLKEHTINLEKIINNTNETYPIFTFPNVQNGFAPTQVQESKIHYDEVDAKMDNVELDEEEILRKMEEEALAMADLDEDTPKEEPSSNNTDNSDTLEDAFWKKI